MTARTLRVISIWAMLGAPVAAGQQAAAPSFHVTAVVVDAQTDTTLRGKYSV